MSFHLPEDCSCQVLDCVLYRESTPSHKNVWTNIYLERKTSPLILTVQSVKGDHRLTLPSLFSSSPSSGPSITSQGPGNSFPVSLCIGRHGCAVCCSFQLVTGRYYWPAGTRNGASGPRPQANGCCQSQSNRNPRLSDSILAQPHMFLYSDFQPYGVS